ncbi:MAG TPA: LPS assembly lipoprotein LptE [Terriglobales bacterium]|nr:LPS assembly lipoprotein LptE [Terriglobales bacterium]
MRSPRAGALAMTLLAVALFSAAACGYHLRGTGSSLPPGIKTMSIPVFKNRTTRYELDLKLTRAVIDEMVARGKVAVAADAGRADAVLEGEVLSFSETPVAFTGQARADRYTITVTARVVLRERATEKALFSNPSFVYVEEYEVPQGRDFESVESEAIDRVAAKFARSLVVAVLEGF